MLTRATDGKGRWLVGRLSSLVIDLIDEEEREASAHRLHADLSPQHFYVQFYLPADYHPSPALYRVLTPDDSHTHIVLPRKAPDHTPLVVLLYLARPNEDREMCAFLAARALVPLRDLLKSEPIQVEAKDERGVAVARLSFVCELDRKDLAQWQVTEDGPEVSLPRRTQFEWTQTGFDQDSGALLLGGTKYTPVIPELKELVALKTASFLSEETPKWILAHLAEPPDFPTPAAYWSHAIRIACDILNISPQDFIADPVKHAEVYGQVLGLMPWQTPYLADACFDGSSFEMCGKSYLASMSSIFF